MGVIQPCRALSGDRSAGKPKFTGQFARAEQSVRPAEAQAWITDRARALKLSSLRLVVKLVRVVFVAAALHRLIGTSPFARVTLPRDEQ